MPDVWMDVDSSITAAPVNILPLLDDTDFKTIEAAVAYNAAGMALKWNFVTTAGVMTQTAVTPTTAGVHDWTNKGAGMYSLEIPASAGTINNDTEGVGWFTGVATGVLPWRGPMIGFRAAAINNSLIDGATLDVNITAMAAGVVTSATIAADAITDAKVASDVTIASVTGSVGSVTGAVGSVTGAVGSVTGAVGSVTGAVGSIAAGGISAASFAAGAIDAAAIAADAIGASELAADAVTEIQSGLATAASISALNNLSAAQINAEIVDALDVDTYAELTAVPSAATTIRRMIQFAYLGVRNRKTQTAVEARLYANDGTTVVATSTLSDDGTTAVIGTQS